MSDAMTDAARMTREFDRNVEFVKAVREWLQVPTDELMSEALDLMPTDRFTLPEDKACERQEMRRRLIQLQQGNTEVWLSFLYRVLDLTNTKVMHLLKEVSPFANATLVFAQFGIEGGVRLSGEFEFLLKKQIESCDHPTRDARYGILLPASTLIDLEVTKI